MHPPLSRAERVAAYAFAGQAAGFLLFVITKASMFFAIAFFGTAAVGVTSIVAAASSHRWRLLIVLLPGAMLCVLSYLYAIACCRAPGA